MDRNCAASNGELKLGVNAQNVSVDAFLILFSCLIYPLPEYLTDFPCKKVPSARLNCL